MYSSRLETWNENCKFEFSFEVWHHWIGNNQIHLSKKLIFLINEIYRIVLWDYSNKYNRVIATWWDPSARSKSGSWFAWLTLTLTPYSYMGESGLKWSLGNYIRFFYLSFFRENESVWALWVENLKSCQLIINSNYTALGVALSVVY